LPLSRSKSLFHDVKPNRHVGVHVVDALDQSDKRRALHALPGCMAEAGMSHGLVDSSPGHTHTQLRQGEDILATESAAATALQVQADNGSTTTRNSANTNMLQPLGAQRWCSMRRDGSRVTHVMQASVDTLQNSPTADRVDDITGGRHASPGVCANKINRTPGRHGHCLQPYDQPS
jgi:hypothetical protein